MSDKTIIGVEARSGNNADVPQISIALWRGSENKDEIDYVIHVLDKPTDQPASPALLTGLAILALERRGYLAKAAARMFPDGPPTEAEAIDHINLLLDEEPHEQPI